MTALSSMLQKLKRRLPENWRPGAVGAVSATSLGLLFLMWPLLGRGLSSLSYDLPFLLRIPFHTPTPIPEVVIVYMDDASHLALNEPWLQPWNRAVHARLVEKMTQWGAQAVVFDVLFDRPGTNDQQFIQAAQMNGRVVLGANYIPQTHAGQIIGYKANPPIEEFRNVVKWGVVEAADSDGVISQHFRGDSRTPTMAWRVAELTRSGPLPEPFAPRWINYYGKPGTLPYYSYVDVLSNNIPSVAFSNKVVFVGALSTVGFTGGKGTDDFRTPFTRWYKTKSPGVEINATTYLNLRRGDWLTELSPTSEFLLVVFAGTVLGFGLVLCRPTAAAAAGIGVFFVLMVVACLVVWRWRVWFPWMTIGGVQIPVALGWSLLTNVRKLYREKEQLETRLSIATPDGGSRAVPGFDPDAATLVAAPGDTTAPPPIPDHQMIRRIGEGAYGEVWLARDEIGTYHAVKIVFRKSFSDPGPFDREFRGLQHYTPISRSHQGLVHILHIGRNLEQGYFFYIMELGDCEVNGQRIVPETYCAKNLRRELDKRGRYPLRESVELATELAGVLQYLHSRELIHRDIKPSNIIFVNDRPKFADVGLVTHIAQKASDVTYLGSPGYIAPEGPGTPGADVYSLGKVIYEAITGRAAAQYPEWPTNLPGQLKRDDLTLVSRIISRTCESVAARRYQTAAELQTDLVRLKAQLDGGTV